jgi:xanthine dehydrogenase accessory factor
MPKDLYEEIVASRSKGIRTALATIIARKGATPRKDSAKMLIYEGGRQMGNLGGGSIEAEVCREALILMETGKAKQLTFDLTGIDHDDRALICGGSMEVYIEPILPDPVLTIFGAGHVSKAVADVSERIGFKIVVMDDRIQYADSKRFPNAEVIYTEHWEESLKELKISSSSYIFIATQRPQSDLLCLRFALQSSAKYIGMLGSRKKTQILLDTLEKEGLDPLKLEAVNIPAGFDIDSETPEEIAASIAVELIAARKNLNVRRLRDALRNVNNPSIASL